MSSEPKREILIFTEALRLPVGARSDYVDRACDGDENLRCKVRALLDANDKNHRLLRSALPANQGPFGVIHPGLRRNPACAPERDHSPGHQAFKHSRDHRSRREAGAQGD